MIDNLSRNNLKMELFDVDMIVAKNIKMAETRSKGKRKTRRGRKKRDNPYSITQITECYCQEDFKDTKKEVCIRCRKNNNQRLDDQSKGKNNEQRRPSRQMLRPRYSPKAPHNSTQFIMDDYFESHDQSLYTSFESPFLKKLDIENDINDILNTSSNSDIGLEYLFRDGDVADTVAYMEQDFEIAYRDARFEELSTFSKTDLLNSILAMEEKAEILEKELENPCRSKSREDCVKPDKQLKSKSTNGVKQLGYITKIHEENLKLKLENDNLRKMLENH